MVRYVEIRPGSYAIVQAKSYNNVPQRVDFLIGADVNNLVAGSFTGHAADEVMEDANGEFFHTFYNETNDPVTLTINFFHGNNEMSTDEAPSRSRVTTPDEVLEVYCWYFGAHDAPESDTYDVGVNVWVIELHL